MQRLASAATVVDTGNEGIPHARHNKLHSKGEGSGISGNGFSRFAEEMTKALRTLWIRFAGASSLLSLRFQRSFAPLGRAKFMRMRLVRLAAIILHTQKSYIAIYQSGSTLCRGRRQ